MKNTCRQGTVNRTNKANRVEHIAKFFRNHDNLAAAPGGNHWKWLINAHLVNQHFTMTATQERGYTDNSVSTASLNSLMSHVCFCIHAVIIYSPLRLWVNHEIFQTHDSSQTVASKDWILVASTITHYTAFLPSFQSYLSLS